MEKLDILKILYNNLEFQLKNKKKRKHPSILMDFFKTTSNDRLNILLASSDNLDNFEASLVDDMLNNNLIRETEFGNYYITALGIWEIESKEIDITAELKSFFDFEYFTNKSRGEALKTREKVILMTLICLRAFDVTNTLELKSHNIIKDSCGEVMEEIHDLFLELGVIKESKNSLFGKPGNEHKVSNVFRHSEELPKKTKMLYINGYNKEQKYFLNISDDGSIDKKNLKYILKKIFKDVDLSYDQIDRIIKTLVDLSYKNGPNIYTNLNNSYIQAKYDHNISESIEEAIMGL